MKLSIHSVLYKFNQFTFNRMCKSGFKKFGIKSTVRYPSVFEGMENISIGQDSHIAPFVHIWGVGGLSIGDKVLIASHVAITTLTHDYTEESIRDSPIISKSINIMDGAWIGAHAVILPGVTLNRGCVVAAGAVVTKDVPEMAVVAGVPARIIKYRM